MKYISRQLFPGLSKNSLGALSGENFHYLKKADKVVVVDTQIFEKWLYGMT